MIVSLKYEYYLNQDKKAFVKIDRMKTPIPLFLFLRSFGLSRKKIIMSGKDLFFLRGLEDFKDSEDLEELALTTSLIKLGNILIGDGLDIMRLN